MWCSVSSWCGHLQMGPENADDVTKCSCCSVHLGVLLLIWLRPGTLTGWPWTFCWSLSTFCAFWSSSGYALLYLPIYPQVESHSCCCSQPVSMVSFHTSVKRRNVDWQLTLTTLCLLAEWGILGGSWTSFLIFLFIFMLFFQLPNFLVAP